MAKAASGIVPVVDGFTSQLSGMHGGVDLDILGAAYYAQGNNLSSRTGMVHNRPGFVNSGLTIPSGTFQGSGVWSMNRGDRLVFVVSGRVYSVLVDTLPNGLIDHGLLLSVTAQCFTCQVERFFVIQDGTSTPVVLEENNAGLAVVKTLLPLTEVGDDPGDWTIPVWPGTVMAYAHQRLHLVPRYIPFSDVDGHQLEDGRASFISGNVFNVMASPKGADDVLYFEEQEYLNEGGAHSLPMEVGFIHGMTVYRNAATGTGLGSLVVFGKRGVAAFDMSVGREMWGGLDTDGNPVAIQLGQILFFGPGTLSPWSIVNMNNDIAYRGLDGLRILSFSKSQIAGDGQSLSNVPQSGEVDQYLKNETANYLPYVSAAYCDSRLVMTCGGTGDRYFKGLVVLDSALIHGFHGIQAPVYDGVWEIPGKSFAKVETAYRNDKPTLFAFLAGPELWRLDESAIVDDGGDKIRSRIATRNLNFSAMVDPKILQYAEVGVADLSHPVSLKVYFRPAGYPLWSLLGERVIDVPAGSLPQRRRKLRFAVPTALDNEYDQATKEGVVYSQAYQFALEWEGYMKVKYFRVIANVEGESNPGICDESGTPTIASGDAGVILGDYLE